jgi:hypothetical protein
MSRSFQRLLTLGAAAVIQPDATIDARTVAIVVLARISVPRFLH